jgi:hypothetical protein
VLVGCAGGRSVGGRAMVGLSEGESMWWRWLMVVVLSGHGGRRWRDVAVWWSYFPHSPLTVGGVVDDDGGCVELSLPFPLRLG